MSEYTPDTEQVRDGFAEGWFDESMPDAKSLQIHREAFDRWLAEVERAAAEKGWDAGRMQGVSDRDAATLEDAYWVVPVTENPYRRNEGEKE